MEYVLTAPTPATQVMPGTGQELAEGILPIGTVVRAQIHPFHQPEDNIIVRVPLPNGDEMYRVRVGDLS